MWPDPARFKKPPAPVALAIDEVLYTYDGPQIFTCRVGLSYLLCLKIDEFDDADIYIGAEIEDSTLSQIGSGRLAVKAAFEDDNVFVIKTGFDRNVTGFFSCKREDIPEDIMPDPNLGISTKVGRVPNASIQLEAYFAMSFSGKSLERAGMPFGTFKSLIDKSYDAARKILSPPLLSRSKSTTFDFQISRPQFSSLIVALGNPIINDAKAKKIKELEDISREQIFERIDHTKLSFFDDMNELVDLAEKDALQSNFVADRFYLLDNIYQIIPNGETIIQSLELNSNAANESEYVAIDEKIGDVIYRAHQAAAYLPIRAIGPIFLINSASRTFSIFAKHGREVTCSVPEEAFAILRNNELFKTGSIATVTGVIKTRARRDFLTATGIPTLAAAGNSPALFD